MPNLITNLAKCVGLGLIGCSLSLSAAEDEQRRNGGPRNLDTDSNGEVSLQEFQNAAVANIERLDSDNNGVLTIDEFLNDRRGYRGGPGRRSASGQAQQDNREPTEEQIARRQQLRAQRNNDRFIAMDVNGDEIVTADEYLQGVFAAMDRNQDGVLTGRELRRQRGQRRGGGRRSQN